MDNRMLFKCKVCGDINEEEVPFNKSYDSNV